MTLGQRINKLRTERKWSQEKLAEAVGVSRQAVSKWELDEAVPDVSNIISLSKIFNVSTDYLLINKEDDKENMIQSKPEKKIKKNNLKNVLLVIVCAGCILAISYLFAIKDTFIFGRQDSFFEEIYPSETLYTHIKTSCDVLSALDDVNNCLYVDMYDANEGLVIDVVFPDQKDSIFLDLDQMKITAGECDIIPNKKKVYEDEMLSILHHYYSLTKGEQNLHYLNEIDYSQASHVHVNDDYSIITLDQEMMLVHMQQDELSKVKGEWTNESEKHAAEWVYQYYHDGIVSINDQSYYSKYANLNTLNRISPFVCPENALYKVSIEGNLVTVSFLGTDQAEIVAANRGVVREVKDCGEDGVYLRVAYKDQSEIEYHHLSRNFWLSSETEIFNQGQLLGYAMADSESTCSFSFSLNLNATNEIISLEEYCRNQLSKSVRTNVFEVDESILFDKEQLKILEDMAINEEAFKRLSDSIPVRIEGQGIVSEIFGNKMKDVSFSVSSHDMHTLLLHQTDKGFTGSRSIEMESTLRGIAGSAYSAEISLNPSVYYDGQLYQNISLSFRMNSNQYAFYGTYDPVERNLIPSDHTALILFPSDEVEEAIRNEIHRLYTEFYEIDQQLKEFSYEVLDVLTNGETVDLYYPEFLKP